MPNKWAERHEANMILHWGDLGIHMCRNTHTHICLYVTCMISCQCPLSIHNMSKRLSDTHAGEINIWIFTYTCVCVYVFWDSSVWRTLKCTCVLKAIDRMLACLKKVCNCYSCQLAGYVLTYHLTCTRTHIYIYRFINAYIDYKCL